MIKDIIKGIHIAYMIIADRYTNFAERWGGFPLVDEVRQQNCSVLTKNASFSSPSCIKGGQNGLRNGKEEDFKRIKGNKGKKHP